MSTAQAHGQGPAPRGGDMKPRVYAGWVALALLLGGQIYLPTLDAGLISDDFIQHAMLEGRFGAQRAPYDLFTFTDGSARDIAELQRYGSIPWWAAPDLRLSFLRPLSSLMIQFDRAAFGHDYGAYHAHSILWWMLLVIAVAALVRQLLPAPLAIATVWLFALSPGHHYPVLWLANRGGIAALTFGVLALHLYVQHRRSGTVLSLAGCLACETVAVLFGEWVFPVFAYFFAYEWLAASDALRRRATALAIAALPPLAFLVARGALGYGVRGSGIYIDPIGEPLRFAQYMWIRIPLLFGDMLFDIPANWWDLGTPWRDSLLSTGWFSPAVWSQLPGWRFWQHTLGLCAGGVALLAYRWWGRRASGEAVRVVRWLLVGSLLALVPSVASFPSSRLTIGAWLGGAALVGCVALELATLGWQALRSRRIAVAVVSALGLSSIVTIHVVGPSTFDFRGTVQHFDSVIDWVKESEIDHARLPQQDVFILSSAEFTSTFFFPYVLSTVGLPMPRTCRPLAATRFPLLLSRPSERELIITAGAGDLLQSDAELLFRSNDEGFEVGQSFSIAPMTVVVKEVVAGKPRVLRLLLERSVEDGSYLFLASGRVGLRAVELPQVGETRLLPRPTVPDVSRAARGRYERRIGPLPTFIDWDPVPDFLDYGQPQRKWPDDDDGS